MMHQGSLEPAAIQLHIWGFFNGQFKQVTTLYSDLIRQVSLYT